MRCSTRQPKRMKTMAVHDGSLFEETYNLLNAWLSIVPGNGAHNLRRLAVLETNAADLSFLFTLDPGERASRHLRREALAIFETPHHTPYAFNLHVRGRRAHARPRCDRQRQELPDQFPDDARAEVRPAHGHPRSRPQLSQAGDAAPRTLPRSRSPSAGDVTINPFALEPTPEHLHFLHAFVRVLLEGDDGYRLTELEDREVYDAIENLYVLDRSQRRLFTRREPAPARSRRPAAQMGRRRPLRERSSTTSTTRLPSSDFRSSTSRRCGRFRSLLEPLLFYVLHRVTTRIQDPAEAATLKLCVMDEAWRFIQHPTLRAYVQEGLKTWRKRNAAMMLSTQTIDDFASADLLRTVVESCPTKLLLANPALDRQQVRRAVSVERDGTGTADGPDPPAADSCSSGRT